MNFDAALFNKEKKEVAARNHNGQIISWSCTSLSDILDSLTIESLACHEIVLLVCREGFKKIIMEVIVSNSSRLSTEMIHQPTFKM